VSSTVKPAYLFAHL